MARPKTVPVTYAFGRRDRVDPRLAPFGVLKIGRNVRLRKDGRLGMRHAYQALPMQTKWGTLTAYDLHEYRGRLVALGSDTDAHRYPADVFEYVPQLDQPWVGSDQVVRRLTLNPFRNLREVAGIPQPDDGALVCDAAMGGGYVCLVYRTNTNRTFALVVDATTDQTVHQEDIAAFTGVGDVNRLRVVFSGDTFYVGAAFTGNNQARIRQFRVGVHTAFAAFASPSGGVLNQVSAFDMAAVTNPTTARLVVALDWGTGQDQRVIVYDDTGTQVGTTIAVSGTDCQHLSVEADQTDDTINVLSVETATDVRLRTFDFSGTLLNGPTTLPSGATGFICRLPASGLFADHVGCVVNDASSNAVVEFRDLDTHTLTSTSTVQRAVCMSRPVSRLGMGTAVVFAAVVGGDLTTFDAATNALFYVSDEVAHMSTRDLLTARVPSNFGGVQRGFNLTLDETTGRICWVAMRDPGVEIRMPIVTLVDFQSRARTQSAQFGGLLYFAGATPWVYDGRFPVGLNFNERPTIISATPTTGGSLAPSASYLYAVHWEYTLADGSVIVGPTSAPVEVITGAGQNRVSLTVTTPHTVSVALGDTLFGANVSVAVYRTNWNAVAGIPGSVFNLAQTVPVPIGMANYGELLTISDGRSDADNADNAILYTQDERGPVSQPLQHEAPQACEYVAASEARLLTGGLTRRSLLQVSKAAYLNEAFEFNAVDVYFSKVADDVVGVQSLDSVKFAFTAESVYVLGGDGPDDIGVGTLGAPVALPSPGGLHDPWSFLRAPDGLWFQVDDAKLFRIPRGGGSPTWEGIDVQDTLVEFPRIAGTALHRGDNVGVFACTREAGDARFLVRDFRTEQWFEDHPYQTSSYAEITALTSYGETIAYLASGLVYTQVLDSFADGGGYFIETEVETHPLYPFGLGGYGQIYELMLTGEYRGDCTIQCFVSYDDGTTLVQLESFELVGLTAGQTVQRKWTLPQDITSSLVVRFRVSEGPGIPPFGGGPTEGFVFNQFDLLVGPEEGLRELTPSEMA